MKGERRDQQTAKQLCQSTSWKVENEEDSGGKKRRN